MKVLIVEDEKNLVASLRKGLTAEGFAVDVAMDGESGLWMASENSYDVIVLDVMLPVMNGFEVCAKLRDQGVWSPILILTARDAVTDETQSLDIGADDYLSKPFSFMVLLARIRALLRRGSEPRPTVLESGALRVDPAARRCWIGDSEIELTSREFSVLEYLARQIGSVVSKLDILENVWDFAFDGDPNIVEVYIRHLRKKLELPRERVSIVTVRGAGYRLDTQFG